MTFIYEVNDIIHYTDQYSDEQEMGQIQKRLVDEDNNNCYFVYNAGMYEDVLVMETDAQTPSEADEEEYRGAYLEDEAIEADNDEGPSE